MEEKLVSAGDIVVTDFGGYQHWSLVSDLVCGQGKPMLISATNINGTVQEEPWDRVTQGRNTYVTTDKLSRPLHEVLTNARSQIGNWSYSALDRNCEHFVKWASGLHVSSTQVKSVAGGAVAGVALVGLLSEKPTLIKFLGGALLLGGIAVAASKAVEHHSKKTQV